MTNRLSNSVALFLSAVLTISLIGCSNPDIVQISPDTYILARDDHAGIFGNKNKLKAGVIRDANAFAEKQGKIAIPISAKEHPVGVLGDWASFEYQFRVVDKDDPEARRTSLLPPDSIALDDTRQIADIKKPTTIVEPAKFTTGSGFFVTDDGYFVTNHHVISDADRISVLTSSGEFTAKVVRSDSYNDLVVLKVDGTFRSLHVRGSKDLKIASRVSTVGFPNPDIQGLAAKYSSGEVAALSGIGDDPRYIQISVPIQPGNSGSPLVDASGSVVGVVVAQLDKLTALNVSGSLPENVNYAIKGTILLGVLESVPGLTEKLEPSPSELPADQSIVANLVEQAIGLVKVER